MYRVDLHKFWMVFVFALFDNTAVGTDTSTRHWVARCHLLPAQEESHILLSVVCTLSMVTVRVCLGGEFLAQIPYVWTTFTDDLYRIRLHI